ncbi:putative zinc protease [bioreactor metagenome]|uniref:Putative zinc protease n=1 Tax=bioreactor metagenome TaxID=1076179 RepID=A0A645E4S1_9ZZZZ
MEHAAFRHTKKRTSKRIANEFEALGAYSNAFTTKEITCFYVRAIKEHFSKTFEILADITLNTIFIEDEIEKEKLIIIEEIKSYEDDPEEYICDLADTLVFEGTTLAAPIVGTQTSVNNITFTDLKEFHDNYYATNNITISVAGNIPHNVIVALARKFFNSSTTNKQIINTCCCYNKKKELTVQKQIQQAHIVIGKLTKGIRSDERYPLAVLNLMFGDGMSSRLYQNIREKHGLSYSIYSSLQSYIDCGSIYIYAATEKNKDQKAIELIFEEMNKFITSKKPTEKELKRAKEQLKTATIIELESMSSRMQNLIKQEISLNKMETISEIIDNIEKVSLEDIEEISKEYFTTNDWSICTLIP